MLISLLNGQLHAEQRRGQLYVKMNRGASAIFLKCIKQCLLNLQKADTDSDIMMMGALPLAA